MTHGFLIWGGFNLFVLFLLALDLGVFHRGEKEISIKESLIWSVIWFVMALLFNACIYYWRGHDSALQFFTGYIIEVSLSVDNLFVFVMIFDYFSVPPLYQPRVLHWGIFGAIVMRFALIFIGSALIQRFSAKKGGVPARLDVQPIHADACTRFAAETLADPDSPVPNGLLAWDSDTEGELRDIIAQYWVRSLSTDAAIRSMAKVIHDAA